MASHMSSPSAEHTPGERSPEPSEVLDVRIDRDSAGTVLTVRGEVDLYTADLLRLALHQAIEEAAVRRGSVVVDLSEVSFLASSGLTALLAGLNQAQRLHCELRLAGGGRAVLRPLQAAGLEPHFEHHPSVAAALRAAADVRVVLRARRARSRGRP